VLLTQMFFKIPFYGILWGYTHSMCGFPALLQWTSCHDLLQMAPLFEGFAKMVSSKQCTHREQAMASSDIALAPIREFCVVVAVSKTLFIGIHIFKKC